MAPIYELYIRNSAGTVLQRRMDFLKLSISRTINAADLCQFVFSSAQASVVADIVQGYIVEVYRSDATAGIAVRQEFAGIIRKIVKTQAEQTFYEVICVGMESILGQRIVAYKSGTANISSFVNVRAETILKTIFNYNCNVQATTANGRFQNGTITGFTTTASAGTGNLMSVDVSYMRLLEAMQRVAEDGGGDFALLYTPPATWTFTWYLGQLGTDRTTTVRISVPLGTAAELVTDDDKIENATSIIVGGTGEGAARLVATTASPPTGLNLREAFLDARNQKKSTSTALVDLGQAELLRQKRRGLRYTATILQTAGLSYGRNYFLGDLVTVQDGTTLITQKVNGVDIDLDTSGKENISVTLTSNS